MGATDPAVSLWFLFGLVRRTNKAFRPQFGGPDVPRPCRRLPRPRMMVVGARDAGSDARPIIEHTRTGVNQIEAVQPDALRAHFVEEDYCSE